MLTAAGVYLFLIRVGTPATMAASAIASSRFVTEYRASSASDPALSVLRSDLTKLERSLTASGDRDSDCEEDNGYFVTGPIRTKTPAPAGTLLSDVIGRIEYTNADTPDSDGDGDGRGDGAELTRVDVAVDPTLNSAFKPLVDKGFRYIYRTPEPARHGS